MRSCPICRKTVELEGATYCSRACAKTQDQIDEERRLSTLVCDSVQWNHVFHEEHCRSHGRVKKKFIPE